MAKAQAVQPTRVTDMTDAAARLAMSNVGGSANPANSGSTGPAPGIVQGTGADWFGPLNPMSPVAPPEVEGRQWDFPVGYNLQTTVKPWEGISPHQLRALADSHDILREVIETRKDQLAKMPWSIKTRVKANGDSSTDDDDPAIDEIETFFRRPDGIHDWARWLRMLVEDLLVIDSPAIYMRATKGGKLLGLEPIDGATIKPIIDDWGRRPSPPVPAYHQVLHGLPAVPYTSDYLHYAPRNVRTNKAYGYSPVEQVVMTVNIALRRQVFQLQWYTEGNMPEGFAQTPEGWTADQIAQFQKNWDAMLAGNSAARRRVMFVPGGAAKAFQATKEPDLTGKTDEWLARVICFAFSISPQPFISMMNRATAETAHDQSLQEGLLPLMLWVKELVDFFIAKFWPKALVEFTWSDDRQPDPKEQADTLTELVTKGLMKVNEGRDRLGLDPVEGGDELRVLTATGYVLVGVNDDAPTAGEAAQQKQDSAKATAEAMANRPALVAGAAAPKPGEEAQAAKLAAPFRKARKNYYSANRHDPSHQGGAGR